MTNCNATRRMLKRIVQFPNVRLVKMSERLYGMDVIGDVPRDAFVMMDIPNDITISPQRKIM